ncbi:MAG: hypothetical protein ACR9NN_19660 [Nostochopsis sp.]
MLKSISIDEFLQRIGSQPNGNVWSVLVVSYSDSDELVEELKDTISIFTECDVGVIYTKNEVSITVDKIQKYSEDYLIIWNFEDWSDRNWRTFDQMRSRLAKKRGVVLVLSQKSVKYMFTYAPNIVSWIGSRVYTLAKDTELLTKEERQRKLLTLHEWSGLSDREIIELAELRQLPPDPEYGEWLVLLGREDLIGR